MLFESTFYKVRRRGVAKMFSNITFFPNIELAVVSGFWSFRRRLYSKRHAVKSDEGHYRGVRGWDILLS